MRNAARISLAVVVIAAGMAVLPRPASDWLASDALAQPVPTPSLPDILPSPTPTPEPSQPPPGGGGGGGGGGSGGSGGGSGGSGGSNAGSEGSSQGSQSAAERRERRKKRARDARASGTFRPGGPTGSFDSDRLVSIAAHLRSLGVSRSEIMKQVYAPFIVGGPAAWTNTWGAPRYGPAPGQIRTHQGQDVFCTYGDPVLASERGRVQFDNTGLGGITVRLFRDDGSYWYYTHLSDVNSNDFRTGSRVKTGDVIGYCGNSGNAISTPPHVHFGWYKDGRALNTMAPLVRWLRQAERNARKTVADVSGKRQKQISRLTAERRFGDGLLPDLSELRVSTEALWASGSNPSNGAFGVAHAALQAALSQNGIGLVPDSVEVSTALAGNGAESLDPDSELARLLYGSYLGSRAEHHGGDLHAHEHSD